MTEAGAALTIPQMGLLARTVKWAILRWYRFSGWHVQGEFPPDRKFVVMAASHTSNWDFLVFVGVVDELGRQIRFVGKHSLFRWPIRNFMLSLGGVPVDRSAPQDLVGQIVSQMAMYDDFALVIAPEGTRSANAKWKTGFYHIALQAGVPIVCAGPDFPSRTAVIGPIIHPTGDFDADMKPAWAFFKTLQPRHPERTLFPDGSTL